MVITEELTPGLWGGNRDRIDMDVKEIRRRNLLYLLFKAKDKIIGYVTEMIVSIAQ